MKYLLFAAVIVICGCTGTQQAQIQAYGQSQHPSIPAAHPARRRLTPTLNHSHREDDVICTKCNEPITQKKGYFKTKRGYHHFHCGIENSRDQRRLSSDNIEALIEAYENRGPAVTKFEAMSGIVEMVREVLEPKP